jgi:hypothetical protein
VKLAFVKMVPPPIAVEPGALPPVTLSPTEMVEIAVDPFAPRVTVQAVVPCPAVTVMTSVSTCTS